MESEKDKVSKRTSIADTVQTRNESQKAGGVESCMTTLIKVFSWILIFLFLPIALPMCIRTVQVVYIRSKLY